MKHRQTGPHTMPQHREVMPGQLAYDPDNGRQGVLQAVHPVGELLFDPKVTGTRIAFLRPEGGGPEWTADADSLQQPQPTGELSAPPASRR